MLPDILLRSFVPLALAAVLTTGGLLWLDARAETAALRTVTITVGDEAPSPYARFAATFDLRPTVDDYRAELDGDAAYQSARGAYEEGHYDEARRLLDGVRAELPGNLMVRNQLGLVARRQGRRVDAEAQWREILRVDSTYTAAYLNLGLLYSENDEAEAAEAAYRAAIRHNPFYGRAHYNLGLFLSRMERLEEAARVLEHALQLTSGRSKARAAHSLGRALVATGRSAAAREAFEEAIALQPDYLAPRMQLAALTPGTAAGRAERAALLGAVLRLDPDYRPALEQLEEGL